MAMNRRILIQVAAPSVLVGVLLFGACLATAWHVNRLQTNLTTILTSNVSSLRAAQQLEITLRQLRFHCFLYLVDPDPTLLQALEEDHQNFEYWLDRAELVGATPVEMELTAAIAAGYGQYRAEFERLRREVEQGGPRRDFRSLDEFRSLRNVLDPCKEYFRLNEEGMTETSQEMVRVSQRLQRTLLLLGVGGPLAGLLGGYGIARALTRSLYRLSVRVQDMAQQLEQDVASVRLSPDGDLHHLDRQLDRVVSRVAEVTERLQRQQQDMLRAQQLAAVGQLAASVAHEVRNPLMAIKLLVEAGLREHKPKPFTRDNLQVVHGEVRRLEQTVQGFLNFARPPALQRRPCDLRGVADQAAELVRARAGQQKVLITVHGPGETVTGRVDADQLCSVFVNLFLNALDAMPTGGRLDVDLEREPGLGLRVAVSDTGAGISPEMAGRLFTPFSSTKPTGCGLGLSISRRVIEEHGGRIAAANRPGGGACFTVTLPETVIEESHACAAGH